LRVVPGINMVRIFSDASAGLTPGHPLRQVSAADDIKHLRHCRSEHQQG